MKISCDNNYESLRFFAARWFGLVRRSRRPLMFAYLRLCFLAARWGKTQNMGITFNNSEYLGAQGYALMGSTFEVHREHLVEV
jgi:hypothetical protein